MPTYECIVLFKSMPKEKLVSAVKRTASLIFQQGGIIRSVNNLGTNPTPYVITAHDKTHKEASYFMLEMDCPTLAIEQLKASLGRDSDVIRRRFYEPVKPIDKLECKIDEETRPPPYRTEVQKMMQLVEKRKKKDDKKKMQPNTGLDFDPFP